MSTALDDLRGLIIRDNKLLAPIDTTMLGRVAARLEYLELMQPHSRIRDTRKGEWPEVAQMIHRWDGEEWWSHMFGGQHDDCWKEDHLWLPAPPPPADD